MPFAPSPGEQAYAALRDVRHEPLWLADDARDYAARLTAAGGTALWIEEPGLVHGYLRARATVPRAAASFARITATLSAMAARQWPEGDMP